MHIRNNKFCIYGIIYVSYQYNTALYKTYFLLDQLNEKKNLKMRAKQML